MVPRYENDSKACCYLQDLKTMKEIAGVILI